MNLSFYLKIIVFCGSILLHCIKYEHLIFLVYKNVEDYKPIRNKCQLQQANMCPCRQAIQRLLLRLYKYDIQVV